MAADRDLEERLSASGWIVSDIQHVNNLDDDGKTMRFLMTHGCHERGDGVSFYLGEKYYGTAPSALEIILKNCAQVVERMRRAREPDHIIDSLLLGFTDERRL